MASADDGRELVFIKLGGSLITDKQEAFTARRDVIDSAAQQISAALKDRPNLSLVIGHGAGSFGHVPAREYQTRAGISSSSVDSERYWTGWTETWYRTSSLDRLLVDALHAHGVKAVTLAASASVVARDGRIKSWTVDPIRLALRAGLAVVLHGDTIFDEVLGGTILSTEDLFDHLAEVLQPSRILLAGQEPGVWKDFPARTSIIASLSTTSLLNRDAEVKESAGVDVTGGMASKVTQMLRIVDRQPHIAVRIFSGQAEDAVRLALTDQFTLGTALVPSFV